MPAIVTVAVLGLVPVFSEFAVTVIVPLFVPETGETLSQLASSEILQLVLEVTGKLWMLYILLEPQQSHGTFPMNTEIQLLRLFRLLL